MPWLRRLLGWLVPDDLFDVELEDLDASVDDGPDYQCSCGRWLPCRHCHPEAA